MGKGEITAEKVDLFINKYRESLEAGFEVGYASAKAYLVASGYHENEVIPQEELFEGVESFIGVLEDLGVSNPLISVFEKRMLKVFSDNMMNLLDVFGERLFVAIEEKGDDLELSTISESCKADTIEFYSNFVSAMMSDPLFYPVADLSRRADDVERKKSEGDEEDGEEQL